MTLAGMEGITHFLETTHSWSRYILNDRCRPTPPPRHVSDKHSAA